MCKIYVLWDEAQRLYWLSNGLLAEYTASQTDQYSSRAQKKSTFTNLIKSDKYFWTIRLTNSSQLSLQP